MNINRQVRHASVPVVAATLAVTSLIAAPAASTAAQPGTTRQTSAQRTTAPAPPPKPRVTTGARSPAQWTAALTTTTARPWPTMSATLTLRTGRDVAGTPYYMSIYDTRTSRVVTRCGSGTQCTAVVREDYPAQNRYIGYVAGRSDTAPPPDIQAKSSRVDVTWRRLQVNLSADRTTLQPRRSTVLTASTHRVDVGPTPFYIYVVDVTSGSILARCSRGASCTATVASSAAGTHRYAAYVARYATTLPPPKVQAIAAPTFVTWTGTGSRVTIARGHLNRTVVATSNLNVRSTPYYITVYVMHPSANGSDSPYQEVTWSRLGSCGSGTTCRVPTHTAVGDHYYVAFISSSLVALPPSSVRANSATLNVPFPRR